jgi:mannosyltransferase
MRYEASKLAQFGKGFLPRYPSPMTRSLLFVTRYLDRKSHLATWGALIVLALVAFLLRAPHLDTQSLWRDEVDVIRFANWPLSQLAQSLMTSGHNGPLYYLVMRGWLRLAGNSEFALRYLSLCFGVLAVPLMYRVGRRLAGKRGAVMAAALIAISPYLVWYSQDAKMYTLVTALTLLAVTCHLEALASGRLRWWVGFVLSASLSLYIHLLAALMIPAYVLVFLLAWPRSRKQWWRGAISLGLLTLPYVPLAIWQLPLVLNSYETGHPFYPIKDMLSLLLNLYSQGVAMVGGWLVVTAFVFAMLSGLFPSAGKSFWSRRVGKRFPLPREIRSRLLLLLWLFLPIALVYLISLRAPVFEPRYLIFIAPAFYLLAASGIVTLSRLSPIVAGLTLAVVLSFSLLGVWTQAATPIKSDFRAAADYVTAHRQGDAPIMFQMPYVRYTFDYYFGDDYVALEGPWTNDDKPEVEISQAMAQSLVGYDDVWLVVSESWLWDARDLARTWLDQHARLIESASFTLVDVYHYDLSNSKSTNQQISKTAKPLLLALAPLASRRWRVRCGMGQVFADLPIC